MEEKLNEIVGSDDFEERLNEIAGTDDFYKDPLENLLVSIQAYCTELIKYKPLFTSEDLCEYSKNKGYEIHKLLIKQCRDFFMLYYSEKIDSIYSKADEFLTESVEETEKKS